MKKLIALLLVTIFYFSGIITALFGNARLYNFKDWCQSERLVRRDSLLFITFIIVTVIWMLFGFLVTIITASTILITNLLVALFR